MARSRRALSAAVVGLLVLVSVTGAAPAPGPTVVTVRSIQVTPTSFTMSCSVDPGGGTAYLQLGSWQTGRSSTT